MILGQELYDAAGTMLLDKYTRLTKDHISYMAFLGIAGIYIDDAFTKEVEIKEIVAPEIKKNALAVIKDLFGAAASGDEPDHEDEIRQNVKNIVQDVLDNEDIMYNMIELRTYDEYTYFHSANVAILGGVIGAKLGLDEQEIEDIVTAGFLHDIGKVFIDPDIIKAPRQLNDEEKLRMMDHPQLGYEFLSKNYDFGENVNRAVYEHHEWYNGSGYPRRYKGKEIAIAGRVLKCADVYDAMTGKRSYHAPYLPGDVMEYIMGRSGMEFDPDIVDVMSQELCIYPVGCEVELSDRSRAIVTENHRGYMQRPTVKLIGTGELLNLCDDRDTWNITIVKLMV